MDSFILVSLIYSRKHIYMKMRWVIYPTGIIHLTNYIDIECFTMPHLIIHPMDLVVADNRTVPYIYLLNIIVAEEDLKLMKYVSKHDYSFVPKI